MVQCMSVSILGGGGSSSSSSSVHGPNHASRRKSGFSNRAHVLFGVERLSLWPPCLHTQSSIYDVNILKQRDFSVKAGWLFKGNDQESDASIERSDSAMEDIMIFFYQLDLGTRVQYALNVEQYEIAQQLRNKLTEVDAEVIKQQEAKRGSASKSEAQDKAISILRLRADLHDAIQNENYAKAASLRDEISELQSQSLAVSIKAQAYINTQFAFRLGQKLRHKKFGYRAVVCGMDPVCSESSSWMESAQVAKLTHGPNQPFYQVLVDVHADPNLLVLVDVHADPNLLVAYVSEENLLAPDQSDTERFEHPYAPFLFYGVDAAGDFIPVKQLREKFNKPRYEVPYGPQDEQNGQDG